MCVIIMQALTKIGVYSETALDREDDQGTQCPSRGIQRGRRLENIYIPR